MAYFITTEQFPQKNSKKILYKKTITFLNGIKLVLLGDTKDFNRSEKIYLKKMFPNLKIV
jgi:hypothetical protein